MAARPDSPPRLRMVSATIPQRTTRRSLGHAQLSLVEHALCPLDALNMLGHSFIYETEYAFSDANRHRKKAKVRVACPEGLSSTDEFYLWGLLSLAFSQPTPSPDFYATPYYCLRHLGCIDHEEGRTGGRRFDLFRASISPASSPNAPT